ncbi:hypothetical protein [Phocaeicola sartorii]|jgi:hypothetical protein|uniref:Transposase n=1 Tax=Phocaeicola sartorii TaxID=671267 RepID=A0A4S2FJY5_9BACT|nr:hypothetical protein [Phocaeicola sartorii]MCR1845487.1 hypothetical protein [Phocaeicola sartorii]NUL00870.1 hypothetical protein [Phocaeicola sartorii]TGY69194.1 hypothetical protein E5339_13850 [Phocaeicola sartorii]
MEQYSTNLADKQWQFIEKIVNTQTGIRKYSIRGTAFSFKLWIWRTILLPMPVRHGGNKPMESWTRKCPHALTFVVTGL